MPFEKIKNTMGYFLQPAATSVDITRSCSYSDMLLMMGENIGRNM